MDTLSPIPMTYGEWKAKLKAKGQTPICSIRVVPDDETGLYFPLDPALGHGDVGFWCSTAHVVTSPKYRPRPDYDFPSLTMGKTLKDQQAMNTTPSEAPKVTIEEVEAAIKGETYTVLPDGRTTICQLTLDNDFTVDGHSACVSAANFNAELGNKYSREEAVKKVWAFLGFRLADRLAVVKQAEHQGILGEDSIYVGTKAVKALPMSRGEYNDYRGWTLPEDEDGTDPGYLVEYLDGGQANHSKHKGYISWSPQAVFEKSYKSV